MFVYLPIEISKREILGKIFLATHLASLGHPVAVFRSDFFDLHGWPSSGVYIGKNFFRTELPYKFDFYKQMKARGIDVWHLDEEGGIYAGSGEEDWKKRLLMRLDPNDLTEDDKILVWGEWQREAFAEKRPSAPIEVTGSPNFEIHHPRYASALAQFDKEEVKGAKDYILVNTRFSLSNGLIGIHEHLSESSPASKQIDKRDLSQQIVLAGTLQYAFANLVQTLAKALPDRQIVLRPHPAEDPTFYSSLFAPYKNVSVCWSGDAGSWIRRCSVLIHNGCTTAIQALIAEKPIITFRPVNEPKQYEMSLPNRLGIQCRNSNEVLKALDTPSLLDTDPDLRRTLDGTDAISRISNLVCATGIHRATEAEIVTFLKKVRRSARRDRRRGILREIGYNVFPKRRSEAIRRTKQFDPQFFSRVPELHNAANQYWAQRTILHKLSNGCYVIFPADDQHAVR